MRIRVYGPDGRVVREFGGRLPAGEHFWTWDGRDREGRRVASGTYTVVMEAGGFRASEKVVLVR